MKTKYPMMSVGKIRRFVPLMNRLDVSKIARGRGGFLYSYLRGNVSEDLMKKRESFIARTLPQWKDNPTIRRGLSLIAWGYFPPGFNLLKIMM